MAIGKSGKFPAGSRDSIDLQVRIGEECDTWFSSHNPSFPRPSFHWRARIAALFANAGCQESEVRITKRAARVGRLVENTSIMERCHDHPDQQKFGQSTYSDRANGSGNFAAHPRQLRAFVQSAIQNMRASTKPRYGNPHGFRQRTHQKIWTLSGLTKYSPDSRVGRLLQLRDSPIPLPCE